MPPWAATSCIWSGRATVGKSSLAQRLLEDGGIPWLPTDVLRTVLRRVLPELDAIDQDPVDARVLAEFMYPHVEQAAAVCAEEAERFLIEGSSCRRPTLRGCARRWSGPRSGRAPWARRVHGRGPGRLPEPQAQHTAHPPEELREAAAWIRRRSRELRQECADAGVLYVDVGEVGFEAAMVRARGYLLARG